MPVGSTGERRRPYNLSLVNAAGLKLDRRVKDDVRTTSSPGVRIGAGLDRRVKDDVRTTNGARDALAFPLDRRVKDDVRTTHFTTLGTIDGVGSTGERRADNPVQLSRRRCGSRSGWIDG